MHYDLRTLSADDSAAAWKLGSLAFGYHKEPVPDGWSATVPGRHTIGAFDSAGNLVAKAVDRTQDQWFGGRLVPASGVAGVAVAPEARNSGLGRLVLTRLLADARERGAAISTLFPTTPFPYRALGWESAGAVTYTAFPAAALAMARRPGVTSPDSALTRPLATAQRPAVTSPDPALALPPAPTLRPAMASPDSALTHVDSSSVLLRPAVAEDFPAIQALYASVAATSTGMIDRTGPCFTATPAETLADFDGFTVAVADGEICGYASWERGPGYDSTGKITVYDLIASSSAATATLLSFFGSWASVAPTIVLRLLPEDPALYLFSQAESTVTKSNPWMIRIVDAVRAIATRGWPSGLDGAVDLSLVDAECPWNAGSFRLSVSGGNGLLSPGGSGTVTFTARGLALWYAGISPAILRRAGFLTGGTASDAFLATATAGPTPAMLDYF